MFTCGKDKQSISKKIACDMLNVRFDFFSKTGPFTGFKPGIPEWNGPSTILVTGLNLTGTSGTNLVTHNA
jgi:hypothetical protein